MITWIQNLLLKRGRSVILLILGVIIVAFVFTIGESPGIVTGERQVEDRFFGVNLRDPAEQEQLSLRAEISHFLNTGSFPRSQEIISRDITFRLVLLDMADKLGVPNPSSEALQEFIFSRPAFFGDNNQFDPVVYSEFLDMVDANPMLRPVLIDRVLNEDYRRDRVLDLLTGPEMILSEEAVFSTKQRLTRFTVEKATIARPEASEIEDPSEETLQSFFNERSRRYADPEQRRFVKAIFPYENFLAQVSEPSDDTLRNWFRTSSLRQDLEATHAERIESATEESPFDLFSEERSTILAAWKNSEARRLAGDSAHDFAYNVWEQNPAPESEDTVNLARESGGIISQIGPFRPDATDLPFSSEIIREAFQLSEDRIFTEEFPAEEGYAVLLLAEVIPSQIPPMENVRERVLADYREFARDELLQTRGSEMRELLYAAAEEDNFKGKAEELGLTTSTFEQFSELNPPSNFNRRLFQSLAGLRSGEVSRLINLGEEGVVLYLRERVIPEVNPESSQVRINRENLGRFSSMIAAQNLIEELIQTEELRRERARQARR